MTREQWIMMALGLYVLLFSAAALGLFFWKVKRRGGRAPVAFKLMRGPGETLRRRMAKLEEDLTINLLLAAMAPVVAAILVFGVVIAFRPKTWMAFGVGAGVTIVVFGAGLIITLRFALSAMKRYRDDKLGYLGEREVAEHLLPLLARGYRVFHDVPAKGAKSDFNLDHVAIGPSGVALIETKTRRKGRARPGMKDHVVTYDGNQLIWPWGEDRHGLEQAISEADWLGKFIHERTGIDTPVKPVLALPGWWVQRIAAQALKTVPR